MENNSLHKRQKMLIVNQDAIEASAIKTVFRLAGYEGQILIIHSTDEAINSVKIFAPDVIVTDFLQTQADNYRLLETLGNERQASVLLLWDYFKDTALKICENYKIEHFYHKPFSATHAKQCMKVLKHYTSMTTDFTI